MQNLEKHPGNFKAACEEPEWIYVSGRRVVHAFSFREGNEDQPWLFVMTHAFLGWRAIRRGRDLLLIPDRENWGIA